MPVTSRSELIEVLADSGAHDAILGTAEDSWLDFKRDPYDLDRPKGRRSLLADAAAFANDQGGILLLGVRAEKDEGSQMERAAEFFPIPPDRVDVDRVRALIRAHIQPLLQVEIRQYPHNADGDVIVAVIIDPQPDHSKPFIVDLVAAPDEDKDISHAVGWPTRHGTDTAWTNAARIQQLISTGLRAGSPPPLPSSTAADDDAEEHLHMVEIEHSDWNEWALVVIQAIPDANAEIEDFYGSFFQQMSNWTGLRSGGFNLNLNWGLTKVGSHLVASSSREFVAISRTGVITVAMLGSPDFLGWSNHQDESDPAAVTVNPYVIVEVPAETVRLAEEAVGPGIGATRWTYRVIARRLKEPKPLLLSTERRHALLGFPIAPISDQFQRDIHGTGDIWRDAFNIVKELFASGWGTPSDAIPFSDDGRVDIQQMHR